MFSLIGIGAVQRTPFTPSSSTISARKRYIGEQHALGIRPDRMNSMPATVSGKAPAFRVLPQTIN